MMATEASLPLTASLIRGEALSIPTRERLRLPWTTWG